MEFSEGNFETEAGVDLNDVCVPLGRESARQHHNFYVSNLVEKQGQVDKADLAGTYVNHEIQTLLLSIESWLVNRDPYKGLL